MQGKKISKEELIKLREKFDTPITQKSLNRKQRRALQALAREKKERDKDFV